MWLDLVKISPLWQNFTSICLCLFLGLVSIWQHFEPTLAISMIIIGQIFMVVKAKYWKMILPSGHTVFLSHLKFFWYIISGSMLLHISIDLCIRSTKYERYNSLGIFSHFGDFSLSLSSSVTDNTCWILILFASNK